MEKTTKIRKRNIPETTLFESNLCNEQPSLLAEPEDYKQNHARQWSTYNDNSYYPTGKTVKKLTEVVNGIRAGKYPNKSHFANLESEGLI